MAANPEYEPKIDLEASPSTGARETAAIMSVAYGLGRRPVPPADGDRWEVAA